MATTLTGAVVILVVCSVSAYIEVEGAGCPDGSHDEYHKVLILGAGVSGVTAGKALLDQSVTDFVILEGYSKSGGRLRKMNFGGRTIELGANWIQGTCENNNCNPIWNLTMNTCVVDNTDSNRLETKLYYESGSMSQNYETISEIYPKDELDQLSIRKMGNAAMDISVKLALDEIQEWTSVSNSPEKTFIEWYSHDACFAAPPEKTSLFQTHPQQTYEDFGREQWLVIDKDGYEKIIQCILPDSTNKIHVNTMVTKIRNSESCVCVDTIHNGQPKTYCGEYAIITFSIGVLQANHEELFDPRLSSAKVDAINKFSMPLFLKIFLQFDDTFWQDDRSQYRYIGYASEMRGYYPLFVPISDSNILMAIVTSPFSDVVSQQNEEKTKNEIMAILRQMYNRNDIPNPVNMYIHHWETDPLFLGTYTNTPVGVTRSTHETLARQEGRLFFAGEAASAEYSGFVHGAYFAGSASGNAVGAALRSADNNSPSAAKINTIYTSCLTICAGMAILMLLI